MVRREDAESREGLLLRSLDPNRNSIDSLEDSNFLDPDAPQHSSCAPAKSSQADSGLSKLRGRFTRRPKCFFVFLFILFVGWSILVASAYWLYNITPPDGQSPPCYPAPPGGTFSTWTESYAKASKLVEKMTLPEKVNVTTGTGWMMGLAVGNTGPAIHVGFPALALQDGPVGIRNTDHATAFPAGITVGATWNKELIYARGKAHGLEARLKGINVILGPSVGPIGRMPAAGRNWEGFGADPYLNGVAAAETIRGIQEQGVMATIKHFIGNEQEHYRQPFAWALPNALSSNIGDRTLHELYAWPFADAIRAGVASVMCSYQMVNNSYACGNSKLLNGILKDEFGFQGFIQTDWLAQRSGVGSALAGLDMSMPGDGRKWQDGISFWGPELSKSILNGSLPVSRLNDMVTRVVAAWYQLGQDSKELFDRKGPNFSSWTTEEKHYMYPGSSGDTDLVVVNKFVDIQGSGENAHSKIARVLAAEGTVLLKNDNEILPLSREGWSASEKKERKFRVGVFGEDAGEGNGPNYCKDLGCNQGTLATGWGSASVRFQYLISPIAALKSAFNLEKVQITESLTNDLPNNSILKDQDICLVFANADSGEGYISVDGNRGDRNDLYLHKDGDKLVTRVAKRCGGGNGRTIVVIHSVGAVILENFIDISGVKAVVYANLPGQESGNALADILFGDVNPSGKLPYTLGKSLDDYGEAGKVLYYANSVIPQQNYSEGLYTDYRHFDKYGITPRYEFGYGLSYTTFKCTNLKITTVKAKSPLPSPRPSALASPPKYDETIPEPSSATFPSNFRKLKKYIYPYIDSVDDVKSGIYPYPDGYDTPQTPSAAGGGEGGNPSLYEIHATVDVDVKNTGAVSGAEVLQLYLSYPGSPPLDSRAPKGKAWDFDTNMDDFPVKVLRGFEKVYLEAGETIRATFNLTRRDLSYWDVRLQNWVMPTEGQFTIRIGSSSRDLRVEGQF